jgi:hypothetical protein
VAFRFAVVVEKTAVGRGRREQEGEGGRRREKEEEEAGKHALLIKLQARRNGLPTALSILSVGSTRARRSGCAGGSPKIA